jgi:hypothetical protein
MKKRNKNRYELIGKQGTAIWLGGEIVAQMPNARTNHKKARETAEFIVRACNSYHAMLNALILTRRHVQAAAATSRITQGQDPRAGTWQDMDLKMVDAAIAEAEAK